MTPAPPRPGQDHILITGPSKTGTTGLFASIKGGLEAAGIEGRSIFEPSNTRKIDNLLSLAPSSPLLVKTTMDTQPKSVPEPRIFDRIVMTVRDPRDIIISKLLFRPLTVAAMERSSEATVEKFVQALEAKQADPAAMTVQALFDLADELKIGSRPFNGVLRDLRVQQDFLEKYPLYVMQYERFVEGDLGSLADYLGFPVENVAASSSVFGFITRSKGSGEFRQWFTPSDLTFFNEMFHDFLVRFGYELDVELPAEPTIDPATGSEYVRRGFADRMKNRSSILTARSNSAAATDVTTMDALRQLIDFGTDGDAKACTRVAEVILSGHLGTEAGGVDDALRWARAGAQLGALPAMDLTVSLLRDQGGDDAALYREQRRWTLEVTRRRRSQKESAEIEQLEKELAVATKAPTRAAPATSAARPLGTRISGALKDPKGDGRAALSRVARRAKAKLQARGATR